MKNKLYFLIIFLLMLNTALIAQDEQQSADDLAAKLNNPSAAIGTLNTFIDFMSYQGSLPDADAQTSWTLTFQPSLPKPLGESGINLLFRPAIPIILNQPLPTVNGFENSGFQFGNIGFDMALGTTTKKGILLMGGLAGTLPTASNESMRAQWAFGPEAAVGFISKKIILGILVSQKWDVESGPRKTSVFGGQYFYFIPIGKGRTIGASPSYSYDWETKDFTLPLGIGYSSVTKIGSMPFKYGLSAAYSVASPDTFGSVWQIRLQLSPVVNLPW